MQAYIGTSGWSYRHWQGRFYPAGLPTSQWLAFYGRHFTTVEINASFYRLPTQDRFAAWAAAVPPDFRFAVKASRFITHQKKLADPEQGLPPFIEAVAGLNARLGPVLFQLPPRFAPHPDRLALLLQLLPRHWQVAFEFRDPRWHCPPVLELLSAHNAAWCIYDLAGYTAPRTLTADFTYLRLHGPTAAYCGRYGRNRLASWAKWLRQAKVARAYVYFDNDEAAHAVADALTLGELLAA